MHKILAMVIRLSEVSLPRSELERELGQPVDRYESSGQNFHAQIDVLGHEDQWHPTLNFILAIAKPLGKLHSEGHIGTPCLDVAMNFPSSAAMSTLTVSTKMMTVLVETGIDLEISVYPADD